MCACVDEWMDGWVDGWMDGRTVAHGMCVPFPCVSTFLAPCVCTNRRCQHAFVSRLDKGFRVGSCLDREGEREGKASARERDGEAERGRTR